MANVLIDPKMLMLETEDDVVRNIDFFRTIIALSNSGYITICLYKEIINQIVTREITPFPIRLADIEDPNLKESLLKLNESFVRTIMSNYVEIDIDVCQGQQEFQTNRKDLEGINEYYDFLGMLVTPCYSEQDISESILVGETKDGISEGEKVELFCKCTEQEYRRQFQWVSPNDFLSVQQKALENLRSIKRTQGLVFVCSPEVRKSHHHNHIQNGDFTCFEELTRKNKRVFSYLRYFGMSKIIFANFSPDTTYECGSIKLTGIQETADSDIVEGWFFGELGFRIFVKMYFPKGVGATLYRYFKDEILRKSIEELITVLGL